MNFVFWDYIARCYYGSDILPLVIRVEWHLISNSTLGIDREFLNTEYDEYVRCLDEIPDISVVLDDDNEDPTASATICAAAPESAQKRH